MIRAHAEAVKSIKNVAERMRNVSEKLKKGAKLVPFSFLAIIYKY